MRSSSENRQLCEPPVALVPGLVDWIRARASASLRVSSRCAAAAARGMSVTQTCARLAIFDVFREVAVE